MSGPASRLNKCVSNGSGAPDLCQPVSASASTRDCDQIVSNPGLFAVYCLEVTADTFSFLCSMGMRAQADHSTLPSTKTNVRCLLVMAEVTIAEIQ